MTITSTRYDFGTCNIEHVDRTGDGIVIRLSQVDRDDEAIFTLDHHTLWDLFDRVSALELPDRLIHAQLAGQRFCTS